ncbi:hypothetical protein QVD17_04529 [Tagetes erecta]|uniref:Uncharacterized protein n=1 Tax=Tagetes erecta TaxID=13708 RepID=A0AAD8LAB2_TARER|nr:hypothetical protein QVD17_04529 [Tagetes erecta]
MMKRRRMKRIASIRRYMYNDVLRLKDAHKIFDCSLIQWYKTNSERVVFLRPRQRVSFPIRGSRCTCLVCNQSIKSSFIYCSMVCKFTTVAASNGDQKDYACTNLKDPGSSAVSAGSGAESVVSMESSVEENSPISTTGNETKNESMTFVERVHNPVSTTTSSNGFNKKIHGRKCVPQRSPFF